MRQPPGDGNSVAAIVWHLAGNLRSRFTEFLTTDGEGREWLTIPPGQSDAYNQSPQREKP